MNPIQKFLKSIEPFIASELEEEYSDALQFSNDNFGNPNEGEESIIDFDMEENLLLKIMREAHSQGLTFNGYIVKILRDQITREQDEGRVEDVPVL